MSIASRIGEQEYLALAADEANRFLELWDGVPKDKPSMSYEHNRDMFELGYILRSQLDPAAYEVRVNAGRFRQAAGTYFVPDVAVLPAELSRSQRGQPGRAESYDAPVPLVVEIWSRSTGDYDVNTKLAACRKRPALTRTSYAAGSSWDRRM
jgi:Uma2 family endonuclease